MQMQAYQPPQMYLEKHKDPSFFNYEYQQYYDGLKNDVDKGYGKPLNPQQSKLKDAGEDTEEETGLYSKNDASSSGGEQQ